MATPKRSKLSDPPEHCIPGMGLGAGRPAPRPHTDPLFFAAPHKLQSVIADAMLEQLKQETAVNLMAGHARLVAQVLGMTPGHMADAVQITGELLAREVAATPAVDGNAAPPVHSPPSGPGGG